MRKSILAKQWMIAMVKSHVISYTIKCLLGFTVGYALYAFVPEHQVYWALISILMVMTPEDKDAKRLAIERVKANSIGAVIALVLFFSTKPELPLLMVGIVLVIFSCYFFNLLNAARTAIVTLIIVLMYEHRQTSWYGAAERVACVLAGCLIGLGITLVVSALVSFTRKKLGMENYETRQEEDILP